MRKIYKLLLATLTCLIISSCSPVANQGFAEHASYQNNLWDVIADQFSLPGETTSNRAVRAQVNWYMRHQSMMTRQATSAKPFLYYVYQQVKARHMPSEIALLPMIESGYNPFAHSKVGAAGLWQLMPSTASGYGVTINWWYDGRRDLVASTNAALTYLAYLNKFFHGNWLLAVAAYNSGEGTVQKAVLWNKRHKRSTSFWQLKLPAETRTYVIELLALATIISNPDAFPTNFPSIPDEPYFTTVNVGSQIDLAYAAKMAGLSLTALTNLNAGYNRWATDPAGPYKLLIPLDREAQFMTALRYAPKNKLVTWQRYQIQRSDTLARIAAHFHTTIELIESINHIQNARTQVGRYILVPMDSKNIENIAIAQQREYFQSQHSIPDVNVIHHIVRRGESLSSIARDYRVNLRKLAFWNGVKPTDRIKPGSDLTIWPSKLTRYGGRSNVTYTIKAGDTLSKIAARYGVSVTAIKRHNQLNTTLLKPGQRLVIPVVREVKKIYYTVKRGDTLSKIATHYGVSVSNLLRWNHIRNQHKIFVGEKLVIYP
ncbi:MAG: lytic transglycosylase [Legionellaceae bacterium]|nr:lytic transglycosylase [Legionellaceae bacterium]